jgi:ssDNA-binding Zn-finger/Zn-ribbon topoisomerase 1
VAWYDPFLKPARPGPPAQVWFAIGLLMLGIAESGRTRTGYSGGFITTLYRQGAAFSLYPSPAAERWDIDIGFSERNRPGRHEFTITPTLIRQDAAGKLLPPPTPDELWAATDVWLLSPDSAGAPPQALQLLIAHQTSTITTGWLFYAVPVAHALALLLIATSTTIGILAVARETRTALEDDRYRHNQCPQCGYPRAKLPRHTPCPECGCTTPPRLPRFSWFNRRICESCGYDLSGLSARATCPECGTPAEDEC